MTRNKNVLAYTEEEKRNLCVQKFSAEEIKENRRNFNNGRNISRIILLIILAVLIVLCLALRDSDTGFFADIALIFWIFVVFISEQMGRIDSKANAREYYVEIRLLQKLPHEVENSGMGSNRTIMEFFPVIGVDTTTGFESKFYIDREDYYNADLGACVRIKNRTASLV